MTMPEWAQPVTKIIKADTIAAEMTKAREYGALYHATNPITTWFCTQCDVFGKDGNSTLGSTVCWCCGSMENIHWRWVPRFGGGAQSMSWEDPDTSSQSIMATVGAPTIREGLEGIG